MSPSRKFHAVTMVATVQAMLPIRLHAMEPLSRIHMLVCGYSYLVCRSWWSVTHCVIFPVT